MGVYAIYATYASIKKGPILSPVKRFFYRRRRCFRRRFFWTVSFPYINWM